MEQKFRSISLIKRKRNPLNTRFDKIRLEKNERISELDSFFLKKIKKNLRSEHITAYPESEKLYQKIANKNKVKKEMVVITAGSDLAIKNWKKACLLISRESITKILIELFSLLV